MATAAWRGHLGLISSYETRVRRFSRRSAARGPACFSLLAARKQGIAAGWPLSVAGKAASMEYYRVSGGIQKIWIWDKPTGKVTLDAKALASKGLTYREDQFARNWCRRTAVRCQRGAFQLIVPPGFGEIGRAHV